MKKKLLKLLTPIIALMPALTVACSSEKTSQTQSGLVLPKGTKVYGTKKEASDDLRNRAFANSNSKARYQNKGGVFAQDVFNAIINSEVNGIIKNLTVAEDFYHQFMVVGGGMENDKSALIWPKIIAPVDTNGNSQNISFDAAGNFITAKAFMTFSVKKDEFEKDISVAAIVHSQIENILANDVSHEYMIYTPPVEDESSVTEYKIYLFQKKPTSQRINDGWNYLKKNFIFDDKLFKQSSSTYILAPASRYEALAKNEGPNDNAENLASLYSDVTPKPGEKERVVEDTMPAMTAFNFKGTDDEWEKQARPILANLQFNVSYVKDQRTYEEKLKVNIFEYQKIFAPDPSDPKIMMETKKIINLNTFYIDAQDAMRFAERISDLDVWKNPEGDFDHKFKFDKNVLYDLLKDGQFSPNGLKNDLSDILNSMSLITHFHLFEARAQIIDLFSIIGSWTTSKFYTSGIFPSYQKFEDFCDWIKIAHPTFSLPTLQLILEQLSYRTFPKSPLDVGPLVHYELQLTSSFYKLFAEFLLNSN